jgi:hypothetical protein
MALGINVRSICQLLHCNLLCPQFIIHIVQEPSLWDKSCNIGFCNQFLDLVQEYSGALNALLMSDEAYFHLAGHISK